MKHFVGISENGIGTISKNAPSGIAGFFTTNVQTNWVIFAVGKKKEKGRLSFAHVNGVAEDSLIREVFDWATEENSERYFLVTEPLTDEELAIANKYREIPSDRFTPRTYEFLRSRRFGLKSFYNSKITSDYEADFTIDRYGNIKEIDRYNLPLSPLQHPLSYAYRMFVNTFACVFTKKYGYLLDYQFDGDHVTPFNSCPKEWTDAIDDCCDIEDNYLYFNTKRFDQIVARHSDWFVGKERLTFLFRSWIKEVQTRYKHCLEPSDALDPLFERLPKLEYALKHDLIIGLKR